MKDDRSGKHTKRIQLHVCDCRQLHLTYGSLTLHFDQEEFLRFASSVHSFAAQLPRSPKAHALGLIPVWKEVDNPLHG
jgi:hypothetical protein